MRAAALAAQKRGKGSITFFRRATRKIYRNVTAKILYCEV